MRLLDKILSWAFYKRRSTLTGPLVACTDIIATYIPITELEAECMDKRFYLCAVEDETAKHGRRMGLLHNLKGKAIDYVEGSGVYILYKNSFFESETKRSGLFDGYEYFIYGVGYEPLEYWEILKDTENAPYIFAEIFSNAK